MRARRSWGASSGITRLRRASASTPRRCAPVAHCFSPATRRVSGASTPRRRLESSGGCHLRVRLGSVHRGTRARIARGAPPRGTATRPLARTQCHRARAAGPVQQPEHGEHSRVDLRRARTARHSPILGLAKLHLGSGSTAPGGRYDSTPSDCSRRQPAPRRCNHLFKSAARFVSSIRSLHRSRCS